MARENAGRLLRISIFTKQLMAKSEFKAGCLLLSCIIPVLYMLTDTSDMREMWTPGGDVPSFLLAF